MGKSDDTAQKIMFVDAAQENKSVDVALMNKPALNVPKNRSAEEKNKEKIHADAIITTQEGASGKIFVAPGPVEETSEVVAKKSESADLKEAEDVEDILNVEDASGATKKTSEVEAKGAQAVKDMMNVEKKANDVKEVTGAKKGSSEDEAIRAQVEGILNVDQLTSLVKE